MKLWIKILLMALGVFVFTILTADIIGMLILIAILVYYEVKCNRCKTVKNKKY